MGQGSLSLKFSSFFLLTSSGGRAFSIMMHQILAIKNSSILARSTDSSILAWLPYAKGSERPKLAPKGDFKEPLDGRTHHHFSVMKNSWLLPCGKVHTIKNPAGWNWDNWK